MYRSSVHSVPKVLSKNNKHLTKKKKHPSLYTYKDYCRAVAAEKKRKHAREKDCREQNKIDSRLDRKREREG